MGYIYHLKRDDEVVYVGQSITLATMYGRMKTHTSDKEFNNSDFRRVCDCDMDSEESKDIRDLSPLYNRNFGNGSDGVSMTLLSRYCFDIIKKGVLSGGFTKLAGDRIKLFMADDDNIKVEFTINGGELKRYHKQLKADKEAEKKKKNNYWENKNVVKGFLDKHSA
jgi:hypothetical protein